jgi:ribosome-associated heat shock protein Hsp15
MATADSGPRHPEPTQRLDRWLWFARVVRSRTLAAQLVTDGRVRVNRVRAAKPSLSVRAGDVLTIAVRSRVRILKVLGTGRRRGGPDEARCLFEDLTPSAPAGHPRGGPLDATRVKL